MITPLEGERKVSRGEECAYSATTTLQTTTCGVFEFKKAHSTQFESGCRLFLKSSTRRKVSCAMQGEEVVPRAFSSVSR